MSKNVNPGIVVDGIKRYISPHLANAIRRGDIRIPEYPLSLKEAASLLKQVREKGYCIGFLPRSARVLSHLTYGRCGNTIGDNISDNTKPPYCYSTTRHIQTNGKGTRPVLH